MTRFVRIATNFTVGNKMSSFKEVDGKGVAAGVIFWLATTYFWVSDALCSRVNDCGAGSLFVAAIVGIGFIIPAWAIAWMVTTVLKPRGPNDHLY